MTLARRWLRLPVAVADAYALALPAGLAVGRIGCYLGGCWFGTPSSLPWAVRYPAGSLAYDVQLARGLIPAGAAGSLPVHPVQLYEIALMLLVLAGLAVWRARLRRPGSLFLLYLVLQALVRFTIEFFREGPVQAHVLGVRPLQVALLAVALGAGLLLFLRERGRAVAAAAPARDSVGRSVALLIAAAAFVVVFRRWFTPLEQLVIAFVSVPALVAAGFAVVGRAARGSTRWAATAAVAGAVLALGAGSDSVPPPGGHVAYYNGSIEGSTGSYVEIICGSQHRYSSFGPSVSRTDRWGAYNKVEYGLQGLYESEWYPYSGASGVYGNRVYAKADSRWIGGGPRRAAQILPGSRLLQTAPGHCAGCQPQARAVGYRLPRRAPIQQRAGIVPRDSPGNRHRDAGVSAAARRYLRRGVLCEPGTGRAAGIQRQRAARVHRRQSVARRQRNRKL